MRVTIDKAKCQGHSRCAILAPDVFDTDDLGQGLVLVDEVPEASHAEVREAAFSCPEGAITVVE
jgi:ferredoxin